VADARYSTYRQVWGFSARAGALLKICPCVKPIPLTRSTSARRPFDHLRPQRREKASTPAAHIQEWKCGLLPLCSEGANFDLAKLIRLDLDASWQGRPIRAQED
jgi:hypothetical protein